jgi:hypothetical protein
MSGEWTGAGANRMWVHKAPQIPGEALRDVRAILAKFRAEHGWQPGWVWNPDHGAYEPPQTAQAAGDDAA